MKVSAIIPAYNEAERITRTLEKIEPLVDEIIVIDDASTDSTAKIACQYGVTVLVHQRNQGYIESIKYGFREAKGDIFVTLDADGEFSAEYIPALIQPIVDGKADMVQGHRSYIPRPSEKLLSWMAQRKYDVGDSGTGFRAIKADLAKSLEIKGACICGVLSLEVASKGGRIIEIPIDLLKIEKPRKVAWFHLRQFFYLLPWLLRKIGR